MMKTPHQCVSSSAATSPSDNANAGNSKKRGRESFAATSIGPELNVPLTEQATVDTRARTAQKMVPIHQLEEMMKAHCERTNRSRAAASCPPSNNNIDDNSIKRVQSTGATAPVPELNAPSDDFFGDMRKQNLALRRQLELRFLNSTSTPLYTTPTAPTPFKFDPPTFHFGSTPSIPQTNEEEEATSAVPIAMPPLNPFDTMSHYDRISAAHFASSGINWEEREMNQLAECTIRWVQRSKRRRLSESKKASDGCMGKS